MDEQTPNPAIELKPGEMWVDSGQPEPGRAHMRKIKADLKAALRADGVEVEDRLNVHFDVAEGRQRLHVSADIAPQVHAALGQMKEQYPGIRAVVAPELVNEPVTTDSLPMGVTKEPLNAKFTPVPLPEAEQEKAGGEAEKPAGKAGLDKDMLMKGGASIGAAALGGVLYNKGKEKSHGKGDEASRKSKLLKAVGVALAITVPAILLGKDMLQKSQGMQR